MKKRLKREKYLIKPMHVMVLILMILFAQAYHWFFSNYEFQSPIREKIVSPVPSNVRVIPLERPREATPSATPTPTKKAHISDFVPDVQASEVPSDTDIVNYICSKDWDCETAVAIAKSENFWNLTKSFDCSRTGGVNTNGTRDHGLWQINDIHITSGAITLSDAHNCYKATDFAYGLYKGRGNFSAWSAYNNGSYLAHLN